MSESALQQGLNEQAYYLFFDPTGGHDQSPSTVFYKVTDEAIAQGLCELFKEVFGQENSVAAFHNVAAKSLSVAKRVLLEEASDSLWQYDDPDSGVYDPPPPKDLMTRAQFAFRARDWEELLRQLAATEKKHVGQETGEKGDVPPSSDEKTPNMAHEDFLNCGLHLLMLFTQAYYKLLESAVGLPCHAADTELNQCYLWTIKNLRILLNKHPDLADFGVKFEPYLPNLLPTTTCDVDWADMAAPEADRLLGAVQEYVMDKGIRDPAEGSPAQVYIESYRPGVDNAIKVAMAYRKRMKKQFARLLKPAAKRAVKKKPATDANANKQPDPQPVPKPASVESVKS
ncbi:MAG: hypothetical protein KBA18_09855, partial [Kiritimatiellae bacterium]|nr:hypothetical protein [Kiritimatiellia bacterium]